MTLNDLEPQGQIATKWLEINQDNLRTWTAKDVARLVSFAHNLLLMWDTDA